ncbi:MAG: surface polysaccharide polymerase [Bradyrhizobiaceae bacterium]|nr:MAG: surface polysaccharide polymerase [Bradyrhizobiaceae bacterium]
MSQLAHPAVFVPHESRTFNIAPALVIAALSFNLVLSFVNASVFRVNASYVIGVELVILGIAGLMVASRSENFYFLALAVLAWLGFAMVVRSSFDPKVVRDAFIPIIFFMLGRHFGSLPSADRLVTICVLIVAAGALFEWGFLDTYLKYFDVLGYYQAKGTIDATLGSDGPGLFVSGTRFEGRTLLPFLGEHRVSSVFLEPVSLGNFGAIAFAWVLLRDRSRPLALVLKTLMIAAVLVLGDARFGLYLCVVVALVYAAAPFVRPTMIFVLPFLAIIALLIYAGQMIDVPWDNTITGRFLLSGQLMSKLDLTQALGLKTIAVDFDDSGYSYILSQFGLFGAAMLWAIYVYGCPAETMQSWRFKLFTCMYLILLFSISTSSVTIKTGALLWYLAGCAAQGWRPAPTWTESTPHKTPG